jgi:eukaryotic-like serine/threonine-protein kinase
MPLGPGTRLGPYEIVSAIGAGGMGEVYRATDTNLGREVAIKLLPDPFVGDPERLGRFEREAKTLASLNHPNIAQIHGLERSGTTPALVMELVEGETLADRIARGRIPLDEALPIAKQIAEALEAAHEQGIIHRDLKPANIKIRPDGTVKVLDFGLAKLAEPTAASNASPAALSMSPTITSPALVSGVGVLLGTAAYMSPEQAKGNPADKRSDIWAFGCVLYEMLTGRQAFDGDSVAAVLARVIEREPDWSALVASLPPRLRELVRVCLEKNPRRRRQAAGDVRLDLEQALLEPAGPSMTTVEALRPSARRMWIFTTSVSTIAAIVTGAGVWLATRPGASNISRLAIMMTPTAALTINSSDRDLAITPDGSRVIYVGNNGRELFVRQLDALQPMSLVTGTPRAPFVSPDGQWIGFIDATTVMKKTAVTGGPAVTIATLDGGSRGAAWTPDGTIIFATSAPTTGLQQVAAAGGPTTVLTRPDRTRGESDHVWPELLPGARALLFTIWPSVGGADAAQIAVFDRQTGTQKVVVRGGSHAHYIGDGHLIYVAANTLRAVRFDSETLETRGAAIPVVPDVVTTEVAPAGGADAVVAANGTLAYVRRIGVGVGQPTLVWVDRQGREEPIPAPVRPYFTPQVNPADGRVLLTVADQDVDLWVWEPPRRTLARLTFTPGLDVYPLWTPDGRRVVFSSEREGTRNLFWQAADGAGEVERLTHSPNTQYSTAVSPDGSRVIFTETVPASGEDVMQVELTGNHTVTPLVQSPFAERNGIVSPDGRWLAYEANDSGQVEIYVRPYPHITSGHWQVSTGGGTRPLWSRTGQELFYVSPAGAIMRVEVGSGATWATTTPSTIVKEGYTTALGAFLGRTYDISRDGQRFLVVKTASDPNVAPPQIIVVQHFDEELKRLVPTK